MRRVRSGVLALAMAATVAGGAGMASAHGGGPGGPGARGPAGVERGPGAEGRHGPQEARECVVPDATRLTTATSPALARLDRRLDAAVAAGRITQAQADARFARAVTRLSVAALVDDARIAPVLELLTMTEEELRDARAAGTTLAEILEETGVTRARYRAAVRQGRIAARATFQELCPPADDSGEDAPAV